MAARRPTVVDSMNTSKVAAKTCTALGTARHILESYRVREVSLGSLPVSRALPVRGRRLIGPWCFLDRFGPLTFHGGKPVDVAPHPHIGLQTVTWLLDGEIVHNDSLGFEAVALPGGVNVMTAGKGIAHSEQTPADNRGRLDGVQLWVALPDAHRHMDPAFESSPQVPIIEKPGALVRVFAGSHEGTTSPCRHYSELTGLDVQTHSGEETELELDPRFEHAMLLLEGDCAMDGHFMESALLYYHGPGRSSIRFRSRAGCRVLLIGGPPFPETILMWWNFVARLPGEIVQARDDWEAHVGFGEVPPYKGRRLSAPSVIRFARPNPVS